MVRNINSRTTLEAIKFYAEQDFGQEISNEHAKAIKAAQRNGTLIWSPNAIRIAGLSDQLVVDKDGIRE